MAVALVSILDQARLTGATSDQSLPVLVGRFSGDGSGRLGAGRPISLRVMRDRDGTTGALDGTISVWGVNLPQSNGANTNARLHRGSDLTSGNTVLTTSLTHVAFSNYNWVVLVNGIVIRQGAGAGRFTVSNSGGFAVVTFGTALNANDTIEVFFVVPVSFYTTGGHAIEAGQFIGKTLYWVDYTVASTNLSRTLVFIEPVL